MNIHEKINLKQVQIVEAYLQSLFSGGPSDYVNKNMPKNLRYSGEMWTCYDTREMGRNYTKWEVRYDISEVLSNICPITLRYNNEE